MAVIPLDNAGLIAGIVVFVVVFVGLIAVVVVLCRRQQAHSTREPGVSLTSTSATSSNGDTLSNASMLTATEQIYGSSRFAHLD